LFGSIMSLPRSDNAFHWAVMAIQTLATERLLLAESSRSSFLENSHLNGRFW